MPRKNANPKARKQRAQLMQKAAKKNMRVPHQSSRGRELSSDPRMITAAHAKMFHNENPGVFVIR